MVDDLSARTQARAVYRGSWASNSNRRWRLSRRLFFGLDSVVESGDGGPPLLDPAELDSGERSRGRGSTQGGDCDDIRPYSFRVPPFKMTVNRGSVVFDAKESLMRRVSAVIGFGSWRKHAGTGEGISRGRAGRRGVALMVAILAALATSLLVGVSSAGAAKVRSAPGWTKLSPATSPPARYDASMAYDQGTGQLVLFGGYHGVRGSLYFGDTWTWNGSTWTKLSPAASPPPREGAAMAYDNATGQLVLFGGRAYNVRPGTFTWNCSNWTKLLPVTNPQPRLDASMAYDAATGQLVLFGGCGETDCPLGDTWTWNGSNWTELSPATSAPARFYASMAYDNATHQLLLFGGVTGGAAGADTWSWNGSNWTMLSPAKSPPARYSASMAYDPQLGKLVLFGGLAGTGFADTWTWNGSSWAKLSTPKSPPARWNATMAFDAATHQLVLFGGENPQMLLSDTWTLSK